MGYKDHLPTSDSNIRRHNKEIKNILATSFIASPPALTETVNEEGINITPPSATQNLLNPLLDDIQDLSENVAVTVDVSLKEITGRFHRLQLPDVAAITVNFVDLVKNKAEEFWLDITKENAGNTPTVTFNPPLNGLNQADLNGTPRLMVPVIARDTEDEVRFDAFGIPGAGGGGISEPIIHSIKNYGTAISPVVTDQDLDLSLTTGNAHRIYLGANINVTFSGFPAVDKLEPFEIIFVQDATGTRTPTFTTGTVIGNTGIDENALAISIKVVQTFDQGATFYMYDATGGTGGGGGGSQTPWLSAINAASFPLNNAAFVDFGGTVADSGKNRLANSTIGMSWRNAANDGNLEFKTTNADFFDLTDSSEGTVTLQLRAQHAVDLDKILTITQESGALGVATLNSGTAINIDIGATDVAEFSSSGLQMLGGLDIEMNEGQMQNMTALVFTGFTTDGKSISKFLTGSGGIHYDLENAAAEHVFRVSGATPATVMSIGANGITLAQDIIAADNNITGLNAINFTDAGGQIAGSAGLMNFVLTSGNFLFTENAFNILEIDDANGLVMLGTHNIDLAGNSLDGINQLLFNTSGQIISTGVNVITYTVGLGDRHDFVVDGGTHFRIDDGLIDFFDSFYDMTERIAPATPPANQVRIYAKDDGGNSGLFWKNDAGTEFDLSTASAVQKLIQEGDSKVEVNDAGVGSVDIFVDSLAGRKYFFTATGFDVGGFNIVNVNLLQGDTTSNQLISNPTGWQLEVDAADNIALKFGANERWIFQDTLAIFTEDVRFSDQKGIRANISSFMYYTVAGVEPSTMGAASNVGAMIHPYKVDTSDNPSSSTLNDWFGDENGAFGFQYDSNGPETYRIWGKLNGTWHKVVMT